MTHLQVLNLADNYIKELPPSIADLKGKKKFQIFFLYNFPAKINLFIELRELNLKNNLIELLPNSLCSMTNLKVLNVDMNPLRVPPKVK